MKEIVTLIARLAFLALVVASLIVTFLIMTGRNRNWQSLNPKVGPKKGAIKTSAGQRRTVCGSPTESGVRSINPIRHAGPSQKRSGRQTVRTQA